MKGENLMSDRLIWIWLSLACGPGSAAYNKLFESFDTLREIYEAPKERFLEIKGISETTADALANKDISRAETILSICIKRHWGVLTYGDKAYPKRLKTLIDPPVVLYYKGRFIDLNDEVCVAVVGTRSMTEYGETQAYKLSYAMASGGAIIISGMALGCDAMAANGALDASRPTVAVLGSGIDVIYPSQHRTLAEHICRNGMIITEYPPGERPEGHHFPVRNRIISGLSQGTVVVEAPLGSGALITAKTALYQGRDIYAVPGEIGNKNSEGCNALIRGGARVVTSAADVIETYEFVYPHKIFVAAAERAEKALTAERGQNSAKMRRIASKTTVTANNDADTKTETKTDAKPDKFVVREGKRVRNAEAKTYKNDLKSVNKQKRGDAGEPSYSFAEQREAEKAAKADAEPEIKPVDVPVTEAEKALLDAMGNAAVTPDELMEKGFSAADIMSSLTVLEILGYVSSVPGGRYIKNKN